MSKAKEVLSLIEDSTDNLGFIPDSALGQKQADMRQIGGCHCGNSTADQRFKFCKECGGTLRVK